MLGFPSVAPIAQETATDQSLGLYEELIRNPDDVNANLAYAKTLQVQGRADEARQIYLKVLALSPGNPVALAAIAAPVSILGPAQTDYTFRTGGAIETNSARRDPDFKPYFDTLGFAELQVSDLRQVGTTPIQSNLDGVDGPRSPASMCHNVVVCERHNERSRPPCRLPLSVWTSPNTGSRSMASTPMDTWSLAGGCGAAA